MAYRQSLMKYVEKYGVSRASRKYSKSQSYICFCRLAGMEAWDPWPVSPSVLTAIRTNLQKRS